MLLSPNGKKIIENMRPNKNINLKISKISMLNKLTIKGKKLK